MYNMQYEILRLIHRLVSNLLLYSFLHWNEVCFAVVNYGLLDFSVVVDSGRITHEVETR